MPSTAASWRRSRRRASTCTSPIPLPARFTKAIYTRDPLVSVPGGVVIGRMAPLMRRGEEASVTRAVAALGIPILQTIIGAGMLEGGTFVKLTPRVAAFGTSIRCNAEAADQLRELLARMGIELIVVPMGGFSIHIDAHFGMVDVDKALVDAPGLPHWFLDRLGELGIEPIWCHPGEEWGINCLTVRPGPRDHARRLAAHRRAARAARPRGRPDPVLRAAQERRRHPLLHHGAAPRPCRPSPCRG